MRNQKFFSAVWVILLGILPAPESSHAQMLITEFKAINNSTLADDDGQYSDWIEIYNASLTSVNLTGWYLTDSPNNLTKWAFPNTNIGPSSYIVVFASDKNRRVAGAPLHTNFKLDGDGEYLALVKSNAVDGVKVVWEYAPSFPALSADVSYGVAMGVTSNVFLATGVGGKYLVPTGNIGSGWTLAGFDDTAWTAGPTGVGYDTSTNYQSYLGTDLQAVMIGVNASAYVRLPFTVADPSVFQELQLRMRYDDGFVAYLNGQEVARRNAPAVPAWNSTATNAHGLPVLTTPTLQNFDAPGAAYSAQTFGGGFTPTVMTDAGSTSQFMRIANLNGSVLNTVAFNRTTTGTVNTVVATFDFRMGYGGGSRADGMGFALLNTANFGATGGIGAGFGEEPNLAGSIGVGFDIYNNGNPPIDPNNNHVSLHYNGALVSPNQATPTLDLASGNWHRAEITIAFTGGTALVTVKITPNIATTPGTPETLYNNFVIAGVTPYESRAAFGARTGGASANQDVDNVNIQYGPPNPINFEDFNVTSSLTALQPGANVLAIQGLNLTASDADFLLVPELIAKSVTVSTNSKLYFTAATPGAANAIGAAAVAGPANILTKGGIFTNAVAVAITTPSPTAIIRYTLDGSAPNSTSAIYTASLVLSTSTMLRARAFEAGLLPGAVSGESYTFLDADMLNFTSNLPLIIINTFGQQVVQENKVPASMTFIDTFRGRSSPLLPPQVQVRSGVEQRGQSSTGFPKPSLGVETRDETDQDLKVSPFGFPSGSDWVLYAPYTDKTFMNDVLAYDFSEQMGHYAVRRRFVEVFLDRSGGKLNYAADYAGLYVLLEKIKIGPDRVNLAKLGPTDITEPNITGGYIFKKDKDSPGDVNFTTSVNGQVLKFHDPGGADLLPVQRNWLNSYINQFETNLYAANWTNTMNYTNYIDVQSFVDLFWTVELPKNIDGYRLSSYFHKDRGGKIFMDPVWDWNLSFGNANYLDGSNTVNFYYPQLGAGDFIWQARLITDPSYAQRLTDRWAELRKGVFSLSNVFNLIDTHAAEINEATTRDYARWPRMGSYIWPNPDQLYPISTFSGMTNWIKTWVGKRLAWIDSLYPVPPVLTHPGGLVNPGFYLGIIGSGGTLYYATDGSDPRLPFGSISPAAQVYSGAISITNNARIIARIRTATGAWSAPADGTFVVQTPPLRVTELMYHPANPPPGSTNADDDFEYVELRNISAAPLSLIGVRFTNGIDFNFTGGAVTNLAPGARVLIVKNLAAFASRYGPVANVAGQYNGNLDNSGERLALVGRLNEPILDFSYNNSWYPITDGLGFSLVVVDENAPPGAWGSKTNWRASGTAGGSPGAPKPAPLSIPGVLVNETLAHTAITRGDTIELFNPTAGDVNIGGWFLTDNFSRPKKYRIADGTLIGAGQFRTFTGADFSVSNAPGALQTFSLNAQGEDVYLFSGDASTNLTGYAHGFAYGAQKEGVTFGRHVISTGEEHFVAQASATLGSANTGPRVGPVVISEVMYRPSDVYLGGAYWNNTEDEFIELHNVTGEDVPLYDPAHATNTWKLDKAVEFHFSPGASISAGGYLLVVSFDPVANPAQLAAFRAKYGVNPTVPVFGPYQGHLNNSSESVSLYQPDVPTLAGNVPDVLVDRVHYSDGPPWPPAADGIGFALNRKNDSAYGNDPANWDASAPTPGGPYTAGTPPTILTQPTDQSILANQTASFSVTVGGPGPYRYQWRFNGENLLGATNSLLLLNGVQAASAGRYQVVVMNNSSSVVSSNATLAVRVPIAITLPPQPISVRPGTNAATYTNVTFFVGTSYLPDSYQWQFNGANIIGATNSTYTVTNVQAVNDGFYSVVVSDGISLVSSQPARLTVLIAPELIAPVPPLSISAPPGSSVTLGVQASGTLPMGFRWRLNNSFYTPAFVVQTNNLSFLTLTNLSITTTGRWQIVMSNAASSVAGLLRTNAFVTLATDTDGDGLPDSWETANGLNPNDPSDADLDSDGDGVSNRNEYLAGTDPQDIESYLKVELIGPGSPALIRFFAQTNKTYSVQYIDALGGGPWKKLADVLPRASARVETVSDPGPITNRVYRLVTPAQP